MNNPKCKYCGKETVLINDKFKYAQCHDCKQIRSLSHFAADDIDKICDDLAEVLLWPDLPEDAGGRIGKAITRWQNIKKRLTADETR